jgi:hypothetical protein
MSKAKIPLLNSGLAFIPPRDVGVFCQKKINSIPSIVKGSVVVGSPGWGIVHHDSHAVVEDNVVFDVVGAGIVAEAGNEIGTWRHNLTIKTTGDGKLGLNLTDRDRIERFDFGFEGEGYWVQGAAQVEMLDNIAISASGGGINIFGTGSEQEKPRDAHTFSVANLPEELQYIGNGKEEIEVANIPVRKFSGFESYNSTRGIVFWQHMNNKDGVLEFESPGELVAHNARSVVDNFLLWNMISGGVELNYTSQIDLVNGSIVGNVENPKGLGISGNVFAQNHRYQNLRIEGFAEGLRVPREGGFNESISWLGSRLKNSYFANNLVDLSNTGSRQKNDESFIYPDYFQIENTKFEINNENQAPTAKFTSQAVGGLAVHFDASSSFDNDVLKSLNLSNEEIASYGWDFDGDNKIDRFGREVDFYFETTGSYDVTLTVWDSYGATNSLIKTINVSKTDYSNLIVDSQFDDPSNFENRSGDFGVVVPFNNQGANRGWTAFGNWSWDSSLSNGGAAILSKSGKAGLGQVVFDNKIRQGKQTLSVDLKNTETNNQPNEINISVWGINGQFTNKAWNIEGPQKVGAIPLSTQKILEKTVGGSTFDWTTFNWDLDFGNGYQYVVLQVNNTGGVNSAGGELFAIDNVQIK